MASAMCSATLRARSSSGGATPEVAAVQGGGTGKLLTGNNARALSATSGPDATVVSRVASCMARETSPSAASLSTWAATWAGLLAGRASRGRTATAAASVISRCHSPDQKARTRGINATAVLGRLPPLSPAGSLCRSQRSWRRRSFHARVAPRSSSAARDAAATRTTASRVSANATRMERGTSRRVGMKCRESSSSRSTLSQYGMCRSVEGRPPSSESVSSCWR